MTRADLVKRLLNAALWFVLGIVVGWALVPTQIHFQFSLQHSESGNG